STGEPSSIVQRSLIADQPPLVPTDSSPSWGGEALSSAPTAQRIQYEDLTVAPADRFAGDAGDGRGDVSAGSVPAPQMATVQRAGAAGSTSRSVPSAGSNGSLLPSATA